MPYGEGSNIDRIGGTRPTTREDAYDAIDEGRFGVVWYGEQASIAPLQGGIAVSGAEDAS